MSEGSLHLAWTVPIFPLLPTEIRLSPKESLWSYVLDLFYLKLCITNDQHAGGESEIVGWYVQVPIE
jgi:hypothetical protein